MILAAPTFPPYPISLRAAVSSVDALTTTCPPSGAMTWA